MTLRMTAAPNSIKTETRIALLRICLADPDAMTPSNVENAVELISSEADLGPHRALIPLCALRLSQAGLPVRRAVMQKWQALALREVARHKLVRAQSSDVLVLAAQKGIKIKPLRALELADAYYPDPEVRHCHAVRFLLEPHHNIRRFAADLGPLGWRSIRPRNAMNPHQLRLAGSNRVELVLQSRPFGFSDDSLPTLEGQTSLASAIEVLGAAQTEPERRADRWVCDLGMLFCVDPPDTKAFAHAIQHLGIAKSAYRDLSFIGGIVSNDHPAKRPINMLLKALDGLEDSNAFKRHLNPNWLTKTRIRAENKMRRMVG